MRSKPHSDPPLDLVIVGAGVSGLTIARDVLAARPDWRVLVLERSSHPGGTMRSDRADGCVCEWGPNGFLTNVPDTWDLAHDLGLASRLRVADDRAQRRFLWLAGALREVSTSPLRFLASDMLSVRGKLRLLCEPLMGRRKTPDESIHDFARRRIGREAADVLVDAMVTGIFAGDSHRLSLRAALPRMADMEDRYRSLVRAMVSIGRERRRTGRAVGGPAGPGGRLVSFDDGMEVLIRRLADAIGGAMETDCTVRGVDTVPGGFVVHASGEDGPRAIDARRVVLACPAYVSATLLHREHPALASTLASIPYAGLTVVCLVYDRESIDHDLDGFGFLVPHGQNVLQLGCLWTASIFPDHAPDGRVVLRAMVGGTRDPAGANLPDETLLTRLQHELGGMLGGIRGAPRATRIFRHPRAIPQYELGHPDKLERLSAGLAGVPGLHLAGNAYRGIGVNDCVREARRLAGAILSDDVSPAADGDVRAAAEA